MHNHKSSKILVTGTLRSGKTTLLKELAQDSQITVVREVAQDLIDIHGYGITQVPEFQDMVFAEQLQREIEAEKKGTRFIVCDRGTIDIVAFSQIIGHEIKPEWLASLHQRYDAAAIFNKDDINFDISEYDVEFDMTAYRATIDSQIRQVLHQTDLPVLEISGTHQERLNTFQELLLTLSRKEGNTFSTEGVQSYHKSGGKER
jgi:nicotinamide riboside kinase